VQDETPPEPVEIPQSYVQPHPYDAQPQTENHMANSFDRNSEPDDEYFDPYDRTQMNALIERRVQAALAPSKQAQADSELARQYNDTLSKYGSDSNFKVVMAEALEQCLRDSQGGKSVDIQRAYENASESTSRRPGQKLSHLPARAKTIRGLGALIQHNVETGRAKPYKSR